MQVVTAYCTEFWGKSFIHGLTGKATAPGEGRVWESHFESGSQGTVGAGEGRSIAFICPHRGKKAGQIGCGCREEIRGGRN